MARVGRSIKLPMAMAMLLAPAVVLADPVSLITPLIVGFGGVVSTAAWVGYAITGGFALLTMANTRRKQRAEAARQRAAFRAGLQDRNVTTLSTEAPWHYVYGSPAPIGGALVAILSSGAVDQYQHLLIVYQARSSYAIDEVYIEGVPVGPLDGNGWCTGGAFYEISTHTVTESKTLDGSGNANMANTVGSLLTVLLQSGVEPQDSAVVAGATFSGTTVSCGAAYAGRVVDISYTYTRGTPRVNIQKHLSPGGVDTADAFIMAACPDKWTAAHKASGYTYIWATLDLRYGAFQGGPPNITAKGRWSLVYDYRTATTGYSANPALCAADFITAAEFGFGASLSQVDSAAAIAAANACDSQGFECHGLLSSDNGRDANLQLLEDSMAGSSHFSGGVWRILAGAWATPVMTLGEAQQAAPLEVVQAANKSSQRYNTVRGQYAPASGLGVPADYTPYTVGAYVTADGKTKPLDLPMPMVATNAQAQKLAAIAVEKSRLGETINFPAHLAAWKLQPGDRAYVNNAELGYVNKTFRMVDWAFSPTAPVGLVLTEDTAAVYSGTFTNPDAVDPTSNLPDPFAKPPAPLGFTADSGNDVLLTAPDGTVIERVLWSWQASTSRTVLQGGYTQLRWRLASATDDRWQSVDLPGDATSQYISDVLGGTVLIGEVRHVSGFGGAVGQGEWARYVHQVVGKTAPPPDVAAFTIDGLRFTWPAVVAADLAGYEIRYQYGSNTWWESATPLHQGIVTDSPYVMQTRPIGQVTFLIKAVDTSGNYSANAASILTNLGDAEIANILLSWPQAPTFADGVLSGGTLVGAELQADGLDRVFLPPDEPAFVPGSDLFFPSSLYDTMVYTWYITPNAPGTLQLLHEVVGSGYTIEYLRGSQDPAFVPSADYAFTPGTDLAFGPAGTWTAWPGTLTVTALEQIGLRITTVGGSLQGRIVLATAVLDVPDLFESFSDIVIAPGGTRLPISQAYREIVTVQSTVQTDGNGAISVRVIDKNPTTGPLVEALDAAGVSVAGLLDARIQAY